MKTKKDKEFSTDTKKYIEREQNTFLQFETLFHYRNRYIELHYRNNTLIRRRTHNIQIENHESNRIKL